MLIKLIWSTSLILAVVHSLPQLINFQIPDFLNNITMNEIGNILRQIPLPNPLAFDGLPIINDDVSYYLYTRKNPQQGYRLKRTQLKNSPIDPNHEVKFIIHGWMEDENRPYVKILTDAYMKRGEFNVIAIDWSRLGQFDYTMAARNTKSVGKDIGEFIIRLVKQASVPLKRIHIIGHSLGAHVAGFAGKEISRRLGKKIGRITALDAAGPLFEMPVPVDKSIRLNTDDADFVDTIHTDGGIFGMTKAIGHVDFYPNGGVPRQPGCSNIKIQQLSTRVILDDMFCSHSRSHEIYTESINSKKLKGVECRSYDDFKSGACRGRQEEILGEDANQEARGTFFLDTNSKEPFARL